MSDDGAPPKGPDDARRAGVPRDVLPDAEASAFIATAGALPAARETTAEDAAAAEPAGYTDTDNAGAFVGRHGDDLLHDGADWLVWDGRRFARDDRSRVMELAKATAEARVGAAEATGPTCMSTWVSSSSSTSLPR